MSYKAFTKEVAVLEQKPYISGSRYSMRANMLVRQNIWHSNRVKPNALHRKTNENLKCNKHSTKMSPQSVKKITTAINWMVAASKNKWIPATATRSAFQFKINFITLTLSSTGTCINAENFHSKMLQPFIDNARANWGLNLYVAKIEYQKNGNPHAHIVTDTYLDHYKVRTYWNKLQTKVGTMDGYLAKHVGCSFAKYLEMHPPTIYCDAAKSYERWVAGKKSNWASPNSIDVHSVRNVRDMAAYLCSYMTKDIVADDMPSELKTLLSAKSTARMWSCSAILSKQFKKSYIIEGKRHDYWSETLKVATIPIAQIMGLPNKWGTSYPIAEVCYLRLGDWFNNCKGILREIYLGTILELQNAKKSLEVVKSIVSPVPSFALN